MSCGVLGGLKESKSGVTITCLITLLFREVTSTWPKPISELYPFEIRNFDLGHPVDSGLKSPFMSDVHLFFDKTSVII